MNGQMEGQTEGQMEGRSDNVLRLQFVGKPNIITVLWVSLSNLWLNFGLRLSLTRNHETLHKVFHFIF